MGQVADESMGLICHLPKPGPPGTTGPLRDTQKLVPPSPSPQSFPALSLDKAGGIWACCVCLFLAPLPGLSLQCQALPFICRDVLPLRLSSVTLGSGTSAQAFGMWQPQLPCDHLLKWIPYRPVNFLILEHVREPTENCTAVSLPSTGKLWIPLIFCWKFTEEMLFHSPNL